MTKVRNGEDGSQPLYFGTADEKLENLESYHQIQASKAQQPLGQGFSAGFGLVESTVKEGGMNNMAMFITLDILWT